MLGVWEELLIRSVPFASLGVPADFGRRQGAGSAGALLLPGEQEWLGSKGTVWRGYPRRLPRPSLSRARPPRRPLPGPAGCCPLAAVNLTPALQLGVAGSAVSTQAMSPLVLLLYERNTWSRHLFLPPKDSPPGIQI